MNLFEFQVYQMAYQQLIVLGLGTLTTRQATCFSNLVMAEQWGSAAQQHHALITAKKLLSRSLMRLPHLSGWMHLSPYLSTWLDCLRRISRAQELGLFCQFLILLLLPGHPV